jgi:predicted DNA-binding protein YlxM (UPF0122 family)
MNTITLTEDEVARLRDAARAERIAREDMELAKLRAQLAMLEAAKAKNAIFDQLAAKYGIDPSATFTFDEQARTLTPQG